ncbi:MAG TPA: GTP-binding protein, partial [Bryobacterales bacterium]|nr:GTP-binding protein [Bryobacterales bacterium]
MKVYEGSDIRNIGIVGHRDCGKTSVLASLLYTAGATNRFTSVDEGNTVTDFDEEEINRKVTITSSLAFVEWNKTKINFIDTPGYNIFINDAQAALIAAGTALVVVDAVSGAEVQTEKGWSFAKEYGQARVVLLNKMDRERADFSRALADVQAVLSEKAVAVQLPIGSEKDFRGVVDLVHEKAYLYEPDGDGKGKETDIPAEMAAAVESARESLIEAVADCDDDLLAEYLENLTLPQEKVLTGLAKGILAQKIFPVMCMSAVHNIGSGALLDFLQTFSPAPTVRNEFQAEGGVTRKMSDS